MDGVMVWCSPDEDKGIWYAARCVRRGLLEVEDYKVIIVLLGRADLPQGEIMEAVEDLVVNIRRRNPSCFMFISGPIPRADDARKDIGMCVNAAKCVRLCCSELRLVEFSRFAEECYGKAGLNESVVLPSGISALGFQRLQVHIRAKLRSKAVIAEVGRILVE